jgi:N-acetylneuraminic acid mutarotase
MRGHRSPKYAGLALAAMIAASVAAPLAGRAATPSATSAGVWQRMPGAPVAPDFDRRTAVWTGTQLIVFGRVHLSRNTLLKSVNVAAAYDPATRQWRKLTPPPGPAGSFGSDHAAWTGRKMLVWGGSSNLTYDPASDRWGTIPASPGTAEGLVAWTGRELIGWGGGCCGDAFDDGVAYAPATGAWHRLARSPLAASQRPVGAWTGRELIVLVSGTNPDGKPWPKRLARAAAYDPRANTWRRIAPMPASVNGASAVWDGRELLVAGGAANYAYNPASNTWRRLSPMPSSAPGALAVWTGTRLLLFSPRHGLAYDPASDRWSSLPAAPLPSRLEPTAVWTGRSLIIWGGVSTTRDHWGKYRSAGAVFTPGAP